MRTTEHDGIDIDLQQWRQNLFQQVHRNRFAGDFFFSPTHQVRVSDAGNLTVRCKLLNQLVGITALNRCRGGQNANTAANRHFRCRLDSRHDTHHRYLNLLPKLR